MTTSTLDFRGGRSHLLSVSTSGRGASLGQGRRVWLGGVPDVYMDYMIGDKPREVLIPPEKCVYHWLGCEAKRYEGNYCVEHFQEHLELEGLFNESNRAQQLKIRRDRKREIRAEKVKLAADPAYETTIKPIRVRPSRSAEGKAYYQRNKDKINKKKRDDRKAGVYVA